MFLIVGNSRSMLLSIRQSPDRHLYMLCFTSPTIRLPCSLLWLMHSSSSTLKFCHCTVLVSWNSSIIMLLSRVPIFSNMNGESLSFMREWSRVWVSLSKKRLASWFMSLTLFSMLLSSRNWLRCRRVSTADWYMGQLRHLVFSALIRAGASLDEAIAFSSASAVFFTQPSPLPLSIAVFTLLVIRLSSYTPDRILTKYPAGPLLP